MKQILYIISLLLLLGACTDETYTDEHSAGGGKPGKPVPVNLSLNIQPLQSPLDAGTKAGGRVVSSTEVCKGMEISLVKTPVTRAADMNEIKNFWVFQFSGTEQTSTLTAKRFYEGHSVKDVRLTSSTEKNRIIVIANADKSTFQSLNDSESGGTPITLAEFNDLGIDFDTTNFPLFTPSSGTAAAAPHIIFTGSADIAVKTNSQADIMLYRSTAQVTVNLKLGNKMQDKNYTTWSYQFMSIPKKSFYHSIGRTPAFPGETVQYSEYGLTAISWSSDPTPAATITADLPVNLHHEIPYTTPEKRVTNAPFNSTYLQIMGSVINGDIITKSVIYQIHLGSNFEDDYSVSPNYAYTYNITITDENDDDSRVVKFIPGYFGGALKMYNLSYAPAVSLSKASIWRYEKRIEVYIKDVGGNGEWLVDNAAMPSANSFMDGRANTEALMSPVDNYPAAQKCIELNGPGVSGSTLVWYMPSFGQSLGIYVAGSNTLKTLPDATYWTSSTNGINAWGTKVRTGLSKGEGPSGRYYLRCIKDLIPGEMMQ